MDFSSYKAFLFDVDKTLTNSKKEITQTTKDALTLLSSKDFVTGVCTGRSYSTLFSTLEEKFFANSRHIVAGGAQVITSTGEILWQSVLSENIVHTIMDEAKSR